MHFFTAIDFETADSGFDSACALGIVRVEGGTIVSRRYVLIRPPRRTVVNSFIHGITWDRLRDQQRFGDLWPALEPEFSGVDFIAAHNASFDRRVLNTCCARAGIDPPEVRFECTMQWSRRLWNIRPTKLPDVCKRFEISLRHHDAASDSEACALIMMRAVQEPGFRRTR